MSALSRRATRASIGLVAASFLSVQGCQDPVEQVPALPIQYQTEHLDIGTDFTLPVCAGNLRLLDEQVEFVEQYLNVEIEAPIRVSWYYSSMDLEGCENPVAGCWNGYDVRSNWEALNHELVHAVVGSSWNVAASPMFSEGLAVALEGEDLKSSKSNLEFTLAQEDLSTTNYETSGHFIRWLIEVYGISKFESAYSKADRGTSVEKIQVRALESTYGMSVDDLFAQYKDESPEYYRGLGPFSCGSNPLPWDGARWEHSFDLDCSEDHTLGRYGNLSTGEIWRRASVEIPSEGLYTIRVFGGAATLVHCLNEDTNTVVDPGEHVRKSWDDGRGHGLFPWGGWEDALYEPGVEWFVSLTPGYYVVWVGAQGVEPREVSVAIEAPDPTSP